MKDSRSFARMLWKYSEPPKYIYNVLLLIFAIIALIFKNYYLAAAESLAIIALFSYTLATAKKRKKEIADYIESAGFIIDSATKDTLLHSPLPMVIFRPENNGIVWTNSMFLDITGQNEEILEKRLSDITPGFNSKWLMEGKTICPELKEIGGKKYQVYGRIVRTPECDGCSFLAIVYWVDVTFFESVRAEYIASRPVFAIIMLDNYEEIRASLNDSTSSGMLAVIDDIVTAWTSGRHGYICKYDRDRYLFIFEERMFKSLLEDKFHLLDEVRAIPVPGGIPATISIGIGREAQTIEEAFSFAHRALEMALSRGGDQVVIKNKAGFEFYGGSSREVEKRTKVKSRVVANALGELIANSSSILIMGHKYPDLDSIGAAVGLCAIARKRGKKARIVIDQNKNFAHNLIAKMKGLPEYDGVFIDVQEAFLFIDDKTLLIVVDTNRPEQVESEALLRSCRHVAVIDHHRRAASYIDEIALNFHEPNASSVCELVTELWQYLLQNSDIIRQEAEALLAGIVMDTKNFTMRTGSRTFDAAAYLRRVGSDTSEVKKMMQNDFNGTIEKYRIIQSAKMYGNGIAIAATETNEDRVIAAQASDELLNISGVNASFVVFMQNDAVIISARSIGSINVQMILEKLGGGGNRSTAGAQIRGKSFGEVYKSLLNSIDAYLSEYKKTEGAKD